MRAVLLSDLHLGSPACRVVALTQLLERLHADTPDAVVLNGDTLDHLDFRRLPPRHAAALVRLRRLEARTRVVWIAGNHDGPAHVLSAILGARVEADYVLESGGRRLLCLHGHDCDPYVRWPLLTLAGDLAYGALVRLDRSRRLAAWAKRASKHYSHCVEAVREGAEARRLTGGYDAVACGHTHAPEAGATYFNSGSWTEEAATYLEVVDGEVLLRRAE